MNDSEVGAAWHYDPIVEEATIDNPATISDEPPLQFAALYAQSQPVEGKVPLNQLGAILNRSQIPNDAIALILEYSSDAESRGVTESVFYWALHQAACIQQDGSYSIVSPSESAVLHFGKELSLQDESEARHKDIKDDVPDYNPTAEPLIRVTVSSKDAGSYLFKHAVYCVEGELEGKPVKVLRRYRDFSTLSSALTRKYPFRVIPHLPPKRITVSGRYLVGEDRDTFLARRAAGLSRFINLLVQHPIMNKDMMIAEFLFELTYNPSKPQSDELDGKVADPLFISQWQPEQAKSWFAMQNAMEDSLKQITSMCVLCEKQLARMESERSDARILGHNFTALARLLSNSYPSVQDDLPAIQQRLGSGNQYANAKYENLATSKNALSDGPLEHLKLYREMLSSVLDLFERIKVLGGNNIPDLKKKIATTQRKLAAASTKEDPKEDELHRLRTIIQTAQDAIRQQTNRDWLVKMIVSQELLMIQTMQYQLSRFLRSLASTISDDLSRVTEISNYFTDAAESAPVKS